MEYLSKVAIIKGNLALILKGYVKEFRENGEGFERFSDEAILFALLEYSRYPRNVDKRQRIVYIHDKCLQYEGKTHEYVDVNFNEYDFFIIRPKSTSLPF